MRAKHKSRRRSVPVDSKPRAYHKGMVGNPLCPVCHPAAYTTVGKRRSDR